MSVTGGTPSTRVDKAADVGARSSRASATPQDVARKLARLAQAVLAGNVDLERATFARAALMGLRDMLVATAKERRQHPDRYLLLPEGTRLPTPAEVQYIIENGGRVPPGTHPAIEHVLLVGPEWTPPPAPPPADIVCEGDEANGHRVRRLVSLS